MDASEINNSMLLRLTAILIIAALVVMFMILAKSFLIPIAWALLIALASFRVLNQIEKIWLLD